MNFAGFQEYAEGDPKHLSPWMKLSNKILSEI